MRRHPASDAAPADARRTRPTALDAAYRAFVDDAARLRAQRSPERAARPRLRAARPARPRLPRLHRRRALRRVAGAQASRAARRRACLGNPHSHNPTSLASTELVEEARDAVLAFFNADPDEYDVVFTANASGALKLVGESYPFESRRPLPPDLRQPQLRQRHPRVRARRAARRSPTCPWAPRSCGSTARWSRRSSRRRRPGATTCSPFRRSRTSAACSTRSSGSRSRTSAAGTCCSTARRSRRPTGSTCRRSSPTSCRCRSTRCSATRPASARSSPASRRSASCAGRGSRAARSRSRRCRARAGTTSRPATPASRTAPSTTWGCPPSRIGLEHIAEVGHRRDPRARRRARRAGCSAR